MAVAVDVTLYTRAECPLCEKAKAAMRVAERLYGISVKLHEVDIDYDLELLARFNDHVPVIYIDGIEAFRHRVDPAEFAAIVKERKER